MATEEPPGFAEVFDRPGEADIVLDAHRVTVRFGGVVALDNVDLAVGKHDTVMLIGPNGAGKSTLLNALSGAVPATGRIMLDGTDVSGRKPVRRVQAGLGRSYQEPALIEHESVIENIMVGAHSRLPYGLTAQVLGLPRARRLERAARDRAHLLVELLGIGEQREKDAASLSYGTRKLVDIARAAMSGPKVLLLDEPSSGLDHQEREAVQSALLALSAAQCVAVIAVEHHMELVRNVATQVLALDAGSAVLCGTPEVVLDSDTVRSAFVEAASLSRDQPVAAGAGAASAHQEGR